MQFELLRLSMPQRSQPALFERRTAAGQPFTREAWLRDILAQGIQFQHHGAEFYFSPDPGEHPGNLIVGRIGRKITVVENEPPEAHLAPTARPAWPAAVVLIDPTHHPDWQKVAMEHLGAIGRPIPIFESLAVNINSRDEPFVIEANAIVPSETFWNFVSENEGQITSIEFEFVAPNMFGEADDYDAEMRELQREERVQKAKLRLESKDGLNANTNRIRRAADYTIKGAGSIRARTKTGKRYRSNDRAQRISIPAKEIKPERTQLL
jgi:hypothetical protein